MGDTEMLQTQFGEIPQVTETPLFPSLWFCATTVQALGKARLYMLPTMIASPRHLLVQPHCDSTVTACNQHTTPTLNVMSYSNSVLEAGVARRRSSVSVRFVSHDKVDGGRKDGPWDYPPKFQLLA
jgi:hypothetical protein